MTLNPPRPWNNIKDLYTRPPARPHTHTHHLSLGYVLPKLGVDQLNKVPFLPAIPLQGHTFICGM